MKFHCFTLGCKVNQYETQAMEQQLAGLGHEPSAEADSDDSASVHRQLYEQRLAASIAYDNNLRAPDYLGYNGDRFSAGPTRRRMEIFVNGTDISSPAPPPSGSCDPNNWIVYE